MHGENILHKNKGNFNLVARGDVEWCGTVWHLVWKGISRRWGGGECFGVGLVGGRSALIGAVTFPYFCCTIRKNDKWQLQGFHPKEIEQECKGNSSRKSRVEVVEGAFPHISARGYRIISKVKKFHVIKIYPINHIEDFLIQKINEHLSNPLIVS